MRVLPPEFPPWIKDYCERLEREHSGKLLDASRLLDLDWCSIRLRSWGQGGLGVPMRIQATFETNVGLAVLLVGSNLLSLHPTTYLITDGMSALFRRGEMIVIDHTGRGLEVEVASRWHLRPRRHRITICTHRNTLHVLSNWVYSLPQWHVCVPMRVRENEYAVRVVRGIAGEDHGAQLRGDEGMVLMDGRLPIEANEAVALLTVLLSVWPNGGA